MSHCAPRRWANALKVNEERQGIVDILCNKKHKIIAACRPLLQQFYHRLIPHDVFARNCIRMSRVHGMFSVCLNRVNQKMLMRPFYYKNIRLWLTRASFPRRRLAQKRQNLFKSGVSYERITKYSPASATHNKHCIVS